MSEISYPNTNEHLSALRNYVKLINLKLPTKINFKIPISSCIRHVL